MSKKKFKKLDESSRPNGISDADWNMMNDGYSELQKTLMNLAEEVGADYDSDMDQDYEKQPPSDKNS